VFKRRSPAPTDPKVNPEWKPPHDPVFEYLLQEALFGALDVHFAGVRLPRVRRFASDFRPERTRGGDQVVAQIMAQWRAGNMSKLWVYPKGDLFIASDDYFTLAAAEAGQPDWLPCWVLGPFRRDHVRDVQGPIDRASLREMFGVA
jgi:hypothetical protein